MSCFDSVADAYDQGRPSYPPELYDAVADLSGVPLRGAVVVDVGAGTGIATRGLLGHDARVVAIEFGERMLATLRARTPQVPAVRGDGNALPVLDGVADLVTYAQAWHWTDQRRSLREAHRVLRPGGVLAVWWNVPDADAATWLAEHEQRLVRTCPNYHRYRLEWLDAEKAARLGFDVRAAEVPWSRTVSIDTFLEGLRSKSYVDALGAVAADAFIDSERAWLSEAFPEGFLEEPFVARLAVARKS